MHLDRSAVQRYGIDFDPNELSMLQPFEYTIQHAGFRPAAPACVDGMPAAKALGQATPFAALLGNVQDGVQDLKVRETNIASLTRQTVLDQTILRFGDLHAVSISQSGISVNTP